MKGILQTIERDGAPALAIRVGAEASSLKGQALSSLLGAKGCVVRKGGVESWGAEGAVETEDGLLLYGPPFEGRSLDEILGLASAGEASAIVAGGTEAALARLATVAAGLSLAAERGMLPRSPTIHGLILGEEGELLALPPEPIRRAIKACKGVAEAPALFPRSPRASAPAAEAAFLLAQVIYLVACGEKPYATIDDDELAAGGFVPLALRRPRLDAELAAAVDASLAQPEAGGLGKLKDALAAARGRGWTRPRSAEEERKAAERATAAKSTLDRERRRAAFIRRRGPLLAAAGTVFAILIVLGLSVAQARRGRPDYSSLSPRELVETYYRALDRIDLASLAACASSRAADADSKRLSTLTVVSKTRLAYEGKDPIVSARSWIEAGRPALDPDRLLYGITDLSVVEVWAESSAAIYRAEYTSWASDRSEEGIVAIRERQDRDELRLERGRSGGWKIMKIERSGPD